jgi:hypothetical protein
MDNKTDCSWEHTSLLLLTHKQPQTDCSWEHTGLLPLTNSHGQCSRSTLVKMQIRIKIQGFDDQNLKKIYSWKFYLYIFIKIFSYFLSLLTSRYVSAFLMQIQIKPTKIHADPCRSGSEKLVMGYYWAQTNICINLKGQCHEIFDFWFISWISFPQAPEYNIRVVSNFFENSRRYSQLKVCHRCQRHRWQMQKIFNQKSFNFLVWTPLGSIVYL